MSEVLGADLDKMDRLRSLFDGRADHLDSIRAQAGQSMASMASLWRGADMGGEPTKPGGQGWSLVGGLTQYGTYVHKLACKTSISKPP